MNWKNCFRQILKPNWKIVLLALVMFGISSYCSYDTYWAGMNIGFPIKYYTDSGLISKNWVEDYCMKNLKNCIRYQYEENQLSHPDNMLPNGEIDERMIVEKETPENIAEKIKFWLNVSDEEIKNASNKLQKYVLQKHSLNFLVQKIAEQIIDI